MAAEDYVSYCVCTDDWAMAGTDPCGVFNTLEEAFTCQQPVTELILRRGIHKWPFEVSLPPDSTLILRGLPNDVYDTVLDVGKGITLGKGQKLVLEDLTIRQGRD